MTFSRPGSLLPSIKCSNCASEIAISMMGDHICLPIQESDPFANPDTFARDTGSKIKANTKTSPQKSVKAQPLARIDSIGANKPFLGHESTNTRSPLFVGSNRGSPLQPAGARLAQPMMNSPQRPPSLQLSSNIDCAFPLFPSPSHESHNPSNKPGSDMNFINGETAYSPWIKKVDNRQASPGLSHVRNVGYASGKDDTSAKREQPKKTAPFDYPEKPWQNYETSANADRKLSPARNNRRPAIVDELPRTDTIDAFLTKLKEGTAPQPRRYIDESKKSKDFGSEQRGREPSTTRTTPNLQKSDELTTLSGYPVYKPPSSKLPSQTQSENQSPKRPAHRRNPSVNPRHPPRDPSISGVRFDQIKDEQQLPRLPLPPFSLQKRAFSPATSSPDTPTDSGSDESVGSSDYRIGGFVSSPATSVGSSRSEKKSNFGSVEDSSRAKSDKKLPQYTRKNPRPDPEVRFKLDAFAFERPEPQSPPARQRKESAAVHFKKNSETFLPSSKALAPGLPNPQQNRKLRDIVSEKVITSNRSADPAIQVGLRRKQDLADTVMSAVAQSEASSKGNGSLSSGRSGLESRPAQTAEKPSLPALPDTYSPPLRSPTVAKSDCRGCGNAIVGKSVKASDGSLTGRFHKQCFVCKHCRSPFKTADFYVLNDSPYCERHYHQLNGSLCHICDHGIEGQYLETDEGKKYHPGCFTCSDCPIILKDDYYEVNGKGYCEPHAFRAAGGSRADDDTNSGIGVTGGFAANGIGGFLNGMWGFGGSTNRVEKRRTKLMKM